MGESSSDPVKNNESVIILAAGSSSRLGQSKQLVKMNGVPLLLKTTMAALEAMYSHVLVVLGANADEHKKIIAHLPVEIITNTQWEKGMGSSLKIGLQHILKFKPKPLAIAVLVCDQPLLTSSHLTALREAYRKTGKPIIASRYNDTLGVPALFDQSLFPELLEIKDVQGAKTVIENHPGTVESIPWTEGSLDIDTPEDLKLLNS
jgi:molybdenum cofactor cytidylyltransferase